MKEEMADFWNELTSEQKQEIKTAQNQIKKGEFTDYESFIGKHNR